MKASQTDLIAENALKDAVARAGGATSLAARLGITHQAIIQWRVCPPRRAIDVERETGVSRHALRPDIYGPAPSQSEGAAA